MRKPTKVLIGVALLGVVTLHTVAAIMLCEGALHLQPKVLTGRIRALARNGAAQIRAKQQDVQITSFDGARLAAWFFEPQSGVGSAVIVLHGHGDNRAGMGGFIPLLLRHHYAVLAPDARAHGESGGKVATYGLDESRDLSAWIDWLSDHGYGNCAYALGESMGAAIVLQALGNESRFCAVVAESPFSSFREVAYDRLAQKFGLGAGISRVLFWPAINEGFLYAKWRYGIDFNQDSPARAVANTHVPVLLIHGDEDFNIPLRHCQAILKNHSGVMELWQVPGAGHTGAFGQEPQEFERRVIGWFSRYPGNDTLPQ